MSYGSIRKALTRFREYRGMTTKTVRLFRQASTLTAAASLIVSAGCSTSSKSGSDKAGAESAIGTYAVLDGQQVEAPQMRLGNPSTIEAILAEGKSNNQVMDILVHLCDEIGPRLSGSTNLDIANKWSAMQFESWGLKNVENRTWGTAAIRFDRGPSTGAIVTRAGEEDETFDVEREIEFTTLSWSPGTDGPQRGKVVRMPESLEELEAVKGELSGAWMLVSQYQGGRQGIRGVGGSMAARHELRNDTRQAIAEGKIPQPPAESPYPDDAISGLWEGTITGPAIPGGETELAMDAVIGADGVPKGVMALPAFNFTSQFIEPAYADGILTFTWSTPQGPQPMTFAPRGNEVDAEFPVGEDTYVIKMTRNEVEEQPFDAEEYILHHVLAENPAGFISSSRDERVWTTSIKRGNDLFENLTMADIGQDVEVSVRDSDYRYINSDLADGQDVHVEFDLEHTITEGPFDMYNTIAEIPGTEWPDEVVIVSAHLDSWNGPGSQGVVDNGTGSAVTLEAARILAAVGAQPKRTIRFILWTGEEQGLLGSRAYVESLSEEERAKISCVFVDDGGTNYEGGLVCPPWMFDYLAAATATTNGQFFSETDEARLLSDDNPDNDARAGWMDVNLRTVEAMPQGGGSDHAPFNQVGIPGFYWDEIGRANYRYGWHTQNDKLDLAIEEYLVQSSTNAALVAYNLACAPSLLPREPVETDEVAEAGR